MSRKSIIVKNYSNVFEEYAAKTALTPGMLVEVDSTNKVKKHATANGDVLPMFFIEDALQGKGINDDCVADDRIRVWIPGRGDQVNALLADEQNIAIGDPLMSDGFGKLKKYTVESWGSADAQQANTVYADPIVGYALEAVDLSTLPEGSESSAGGAYYNPRIAVRIR